jgi:hypothetical protein
MVWPTRVLIEIWNILILIYVVFLPLLTAAARYGSCCKSTNLCRLNGPHLAAAQHGPHWIELVGLGDLFVPLLPEAVWHGALWESSISSLPLWALDVDLSFHFPLHLHTAAVWHGSHSDVLDGRVDLSPCRGRLMRCTLRVFAPSGVGAVRTMRFFLFLTYTAES